LEHGKEETIMPEKSRLGTILVATDFSENAEAATAWAAQIARDHGARLVLAHAILPESSPVPELVALPPEYFEHVRAGAQRRLDDKATTLREQGMDVASDLVIGGVVDAVLGAAERLRPDLIVAGTRGWTGWKRLLLGSFVSGLVRGARCPVLTISPHAHAPRRLRTALVAIDFSPEASLAATAATRLLSGDGQRRMVLLHAYRVPSDAVYLSSAMLADAIRSAGAAADRRLREIAAELSSSNLTTDTMGRKGYPPEVILEQARALDADMIAMGTRGRSQLDFAVLGSIAQSVLAFAPCPVLTVRAAQSG
jgi:nucleotide-binding universal stress UspA family protein